MKNKTIILLVLVALLALPAVAAAATEFSLGGYLKLEAWYDSAAIPKNINAPPLRNNHPDGQHGRFNATAQSSRFSFTIKGPDIWGAKTTGYLEVDFDKDFEARQSASHAYGPRLRHAFFRLNWPETELLFGQYWSMFCEFYPELVQDGPYQGHGVATHRLAQARVTQTFGVGPGKLRLAALVGKPTDTNDQGAGRVPGTVNATPNYPITTSTGPLEGQTSETPQFQGLIQWEGDLWGKAGFYGRPRGFTAQVVGGWQRTRYRAADYARSSDIGGVGSSDRRFFDERLRGFGVRTSTDSFGESTFRRVNAFQFDQEYKNNWMVQGTLFIPVIPTATQNLAGTAALTVQAYVGEGLDAFGNVTGFNSFFRPTVTWFEGNNEFALVERRLTKTWGGYVQGNYYFTNQWFMTVAAGLGSNFGINRSDLFLSTVDPVHHWWEVDAALYYRPITALKFGLQYTYTRADYYQNTDVRFARIDDPSRTVSPTATNMGEAHSVRFGAWFFF